MKRHFITGAVVGGVATAVSFLLFSPVNGEEIVDEFEVELEANGVGLDDDDEDKKEK